LYAAYKDRIEFLIVYVREAHPEMLPDGNKTGIVGRPKNIDERIILASNCVSEYEFTIPMVIDGMDGKVNENYKAAPVRVTVTDIDGKVAYYADPGPFDFKLSKVERVLKKLVAHNGRVPPPPETSWGKPDNGLRLGLSLDPPGLVPGDEVTVLLKFQNRSKKEIYLLFSSDDALDKLVIENSEGLALMIDPAPDNSWMGQMMSRMRKQGGFRMRPQTIKPGELFESAIDGKIIFSTNRLEPAPVGRYNASYTFVADKEVSFRSRRSNSTRTAWSGNMSSGTFAIKLGPAPQKSCIDCHGDGDYHHEHEEDCSLCHAEEPEPAKETINPEACSSCHKRNDAKGRLQILGPGGEFDNGSVHISGKIGDEHCMACHDLSRHRQGKVSLIDARSGRKGPWERPETGFCLSCHGNDPPEGVSFPVSKGSGYNKSGFRETSPAKEGKDCTHCHAVHGSSNPSLLKLEEIRSPH